MQPVDQTPVSQIDLTEKTESAFKPAYELEKFVSLIGLDYKDPSFSEKNLIHDIILQAKNPKTNPHLQERFRNII